MARQQVVLSEERRCRMTSVPRAPRLAFDRVVSFPGALPANTLILAARRRAG